MRARDSGRKSRLRTHLLRSNTVRFRIGETHQLPKLSREIFSSNKGRRIPFLPQPRLYLIDLGELAGASQFEGALQSVYVGFHG